MKSWSLLLFVLLFLSSCLKEELPIDKPLLGNGESTIEQFSIGKEYYDQVYYNIEEGKIVLRVNRNAWDLGFETAADGFHVIINNSRAGGLRKTNKTDFSKVMSDNTVDWGYDSPSWSMDSTFIGDWRGDSSIYVFFLGVDNDAATSMNKYKFRVMDVTPTEYKIEYCLLSETEPTTAIVPKREGYRFSMFSLVSGQEVTEQVVPKDTDYDVCFRSYTYIYPDGIPYLVVGCLLNPYGTAATKKLEKTKFDEVNYEDVLTAQFSNVVDQIGFDWKEYGLSVTYYTVYPEMNYLLKTQNNRYYKLHFLDYYDDSGVKGAPKFEFQELQP